jgi:hypothetical protein
MTDRLHAPHTTGGGDFDPHRFFLAIRESEREKNSKSGRRQTTEATDGDSGG